MEFREGRHRLSGPVTMANTAALRASGLRDFAARSEAVVEVDLSGVTDVDSSALSLLFEWRRMLTGQGRDLRTHGLPANLRSLAGVYEVLDLLPGA